ncbi:PucR family transcriptional regulator [Actinomadura fibrosa]|uniref:PucR family transcriptional regulator n=1 Tax=Actinomadura fibrosa TaxID=111802 RepID=A0ABW2XFZ6_9ACTN|nr:helix-turn-helix domain-containing protein [Actinomadura fibrosa]
MTDPARRWLLGLRAEEHPRPACAAPTLAAARELLGPGPVGWAVATAAAMTEEIVERVPEHGGGPGPVETLRRSVEATVLLALYGLLVDGRVGTEFVAPEAVEGNSDLARRGTPLDRVLRGVRIGHARLHRELMAAIGTQDEPVRQAETHRVTELLFTYADIQASRLAEEYIAERDRWQRSTESARRRVVEDLLAGRHVGSATAARVLGYDLERHHLALIIWVGSPDTAAAELDRYAAAYSRELGADRLLTVPAGRSVLWAWTSWAARPPEDVTARAPGGDLRAAVGPVASGRDGFRRSHLGAREAERIARLRGTARLTSYLDVRVAALVMTDPEHGRWFVREVLGPLADPGDSRAAELRETLRVYLAEGRSPQQAAERLHVNRNTVTYRIRRAEELLGRPVGAGLEVWLALEAARAMPPEP